jgi:hypothetical protein
MLTRTALELVVDPVLVWLEANASVERDDRARRLMLAIGLQESDLLHRRQLGGGPGRGLWQFEKTGAVLGVLSHPATEGVARTVCGRFSLADTPDAVHPALAECDALAAAFARLLLWTDVRSLPVTEAQGWETYLRVWRPGRPRRDAWGPAWAGAVRAVRDVPAAPAGCAGNSSYDRAGVMN